MDSVMEQIRRVRQNKADSGQVLTSGTVIDGCEVKIRFDPVGDNKIMDTVRSMLKSALMNATATSQGGV